MSTEPEGPAPAAGDGFDEAQQQALVLIGQALIAQSIAGTVALELTVTQAVVAQNVDLDFRLNMERQSGFVLPAEAGDELVEAVQQLILLWREHGREPFHTFTYHLTRGDTGPRFTSEFEY